MVMHENPDTRLSIKTLLEKNLYDVIEVESFEDFLKKIEGEKPDLILQNGLMPRNKILEIIQNKGLKVVFFIADDVDQKELSLYKNVIGFIDEPREIEKFLKEIDRFLKKSKN